MSLTETISATVVAGLVLAIVFYLTGALRTRSALTGATIRLLLPDAFPANARLVLRHVRDGKDQVDDKGPMLNEDSDFGQGINHNEWTVTVEFPKRIGFQFKCYLEYQAGSKDEALTFLGSAGVIEVSEDETHDTRLWFLLPHAPTCETVDHYTNNYFHPNIHEIRHEA